MLYYNKSSMKQLALFVFVFCGIFFNARVSYAQTETTISVAPAILDLAVNPGEITQAMITIRSGGGFALPVSVSPKSLLIEDEIINISVKNASDASSWLELDSSEFLLAENETKKVLIDIIVPDDASPGGHYAQLSVRGLSLEQSLDAGASIVIPEVAVTILITVAGELNASMNVEQSGNLFPFFSTPSTNLMKTFTIVNDGNIHDLIVPNLVIEKNGVELYRQKLSSKIVLPQTRKEFNETFQLPDDYGIYKAFLEMRYANGQKIIITDKETVFVTPKLWSIFFVGIFTIGGLYIYNHRKNLHNAWQVLTEKDS
jgi:hypothetical protein